MTRVVTCLHMATTEDSPGPPPSKRIRLEDCSNHIEVQITHLPFEVLEQIFVHLPIHSLTCCRLVCGSWNAIISNDKFLCWKKCYFQFKYNRKDISKVLPCLELPPCGAHTDFIPFLTNTATVKFETLAPPTNPNAILQLLPQHKIVSKTIKDCSSLLKGEESLPFPATISLMILFSDSVDDVLMILNTLVSSCPSIISVLELFYFLCHVFNKLWNEGKLPQKHHYMVYHALAVFERSPSVSPSLSSGGCQLALTSEQLKIKNHKLAPKETIKIEAFAGTGKTTALVKFAEANPSLKFLYTVYNSSMQQSAEEIFRFTRNVDCRTFHSIAYEAIKFKFGFQHSKILYGSLEKYHLNKYLADEGKEYEKHHRTCLHKSLKNFFASDDEELVMELHVPHLSELIRNDYENHVIDSNGQQRKQIFELAKTAWAEMIDKNNTETLLSHDGYLKFYQLNDPVITRYDGSEYDCFLVDEAQDITPAIKSIIDNQSNVSKIYVGDPHQQIYSFRGAVNALYRITPDHTFCLTQSFRFGPQIAYLASCVLDILKEIRKQTITGSMKQDGYYGVPIGQVAFIARTNSMVFDTAIELCQAYTHGSVGLTCDMKEFKKGLNTIHDVYRVYRNKELKLIKNKLIKTMLKDERPYESLKEYAIRKMDSSILRKTQMVEQHGDAVVGIITLVESRVTSSWKDADFIITTAHKSKGLEFDTVVVCDDFIPGYFDDINRSMLTGGQQDVPVDEKNLLYVAITRATQQVFLSPTILKLLRRANEYFLYHDNKDSQAPPTLCVMCGNALNEEQSSNVCRHEVNTSFPNLSSNQSPLSQGTACLPCAVRYLPHLKKILVK